MAFTFRQLEESDLSLLHEWLERPHVKEWWGDQGGLSGVKRDYRALTDPSGTTRGYLALLHGKPLGFIQSYVVMGSAGGWWEGETDPGARGIDQFLADAALLARGMGTELICDFVAELFRDPEVTKVQTDPDPGNARAIRSYEKAGFTAVGEVTTPDGQALLMVRPRGTVVDLPPTQ